LNYRLTHDELLEYNKPRVLAILTAQTAKRGFCTPEDITRRLNLSAAQLIEIRDILLSEGKIEPAP